MAICSILRSHGSRSTIPPRHVVGSIVLQFLTIDECQNYFIKNRNATVIDLEGCWPAWPGFWQGAILKFFELNNSCFTTIVPNHLSETNSVASPMLLSSLAHLCRSSAQLPTILLSIRGLEDSISGRKTPALVSQHVGHIKRLKCNLPAITAPAFFPEELSYRHVQIIVSETTRVPGVKLDLGINSKMTLEFRQFIRTSLLFVFVIGT